MGFVTYGRVLSHMGSAKIHLGFVKYGLGICQIWGAQKGQSASITWTLPCSVQFYFVGFVKHGMGFVTYGLKKDSLSFCHKWMDFVMDFVIYWLYSGTTT